MSILEWVTLITAIWGAVTGTIALIMKFREDMEDKPNLLIQPQFEFTGFKLPLDINHLKVTETNIGHRPTTLDATYVIFRPRNFLLRLVWKIQKKGKVWITTPYKFEQTISEGRHIDFYISPEKIWKPEGLDLIDLERIVVKDKAGREWKSKNEFGQKELKLNSLVEIVESAFIQSFDPKKEFEIYLFRTQKRYDLRYRYLIGNTHKYRYARFTSLDEAKNTYRDDCSRGEKFIAGEIENPEIIEVYVK